MKDFWIIFLLLNTTTGRIILGIIIVYFIGYILVSLLGWWLLPIIPAIIGIILLYDYYIAHKENHVNLKKEMIGGICLLVFAVLSALFVTFHIYKEVFWGKQYDNYQQLPIYDSLDVEEYVDTTTFVPDTVAFSETVKPSSVTSGVRSHSHSTHKHDDNMRGFDPASEDDMDDNGMSRYMENNDEEGWD